MELLEKIDARVARLAALGHWKTARDVVGAEADAKFEKELERLLGRYPFVRQAPDWLAFLTRYGGGTLTRDDDMLSLGLYGFSHDATLHILDGAGEPVDYGCLYFCDVVLPREPVKGYTDETISLGFGFEASGERSWGVYRIRDGNSEWYCETFLEWLERFVEKEGRLLD
jgi:hypothetical protein